MHYPIFLLVVLLPAIFADELSPKSENLRADLWGSDSQILTYKRRNRPDIQVQVELKCGTGRLQDSFSVQASLLGGYSLASQSSISLGNKKGRFTVPNVILDGQLSTLQNVASSENCSGSPLPAGCARSLKGSVTASLLIVVPYSISPLAWLININLNIECRIAPVDPPTECLPPLDEPPCIPNLIIDHCEEFNHSITISNVPECNDTSGPEPCDACVVAVTVTSNMRKNGFGYSLKNCEISRRLPESHTFLVEKGRTVKRPNGVQVTGRVGKKFGQDYELTVRNLNTVNNGQVNCEVERCRYGSVTYGIDNLPQCPEDALPETTASTAVVRQSSGRAAPGPLNLLPGTVTLVLNDLTSARSSFQDKRCSGSKIN
jgi:hypothetical protein